MTHAARKRTLLTAGMVGALISAPFAVSAVSAETTTPADRTLSVTLAKNAYHDTDLAPKGPSSGDGWEGAGAVTLDGTPVGRIEVISTLLDAKYQAMVQSGTFILGDGNISYSGSAINKQAPGTPKPTDTIDCAITGGTGAYAGARGTIKLTPIDDSNMKVTAAFDFLGAGE